MARLYRVQILIMARLYRVQILVMVMIRLLGRDQLLAELPHSVAGEGEEPSAPFFRRPHNRFDSVFNGVRLVHDFSTHSGILVDGTQDALSNGPYPPMRVLGGLLQKGPIVGIQVTGISQGQGFIVHGIDVATKTPAARAHPPA